MAHETNTHNLTSHWRALDAAHHVHPFTDTAALNKEGVRVIVKSDGVYLWDSEGAKLIDGMAGLWCVQVGYGNAELAEAGYEALKTLPYYNHFFKTTNPWTAELAAKLARILPDGHDHVLFANSGSEANDTALKLIRYYWNLKGKPDKKIHLSREYAYHGVTMAAASLSGLTPMHPQFDLPLAGFAKVPAPYWFGAKAAGYGDIDPEEFGLLIARKLEDSILEIGADRVASFSAEPIQGAGGLIFPPATYWLEVQRICAKYDVLLHLDEVITGFGRTGEWFGAQTYAISPDIMTMAKGLSSGYQPISAISLGDRMGKTILNANEELVHGYTYSGHPVASAVALKNLEVIEKKGLVHRTRQTIGPYLHRRLQEAFEAHPLVGEVRCIGLLAAIELVPNKTERRFFENSGDVGTICRNYCFKNGLVMRAIRDTMVLSPPLVVTESEVDEIVLKAKDAIDRTAHDLGNVAMELRLVSVNVAEPQIIGRINGEAVLSGIAKRPIGPQPVFVSATNIAGDGQADLSVHGGVDKAVYAYPVDHWPWWEREKTLPCRPATFGENLTLAGADETVVAIGDRFRWGDAILEICQPRAPCFKFAIHTARPDAPQLMTISGRCGWYCRVVEEGYAPTLDGSIRRIFESKGPSVREAFDAVFNPRVGTDCLRRVAQADGLAESWRKPVSKRLAGVAESQ